MLLIPRGVRLFPGVAFPKDDEASIAPSISYFPPLSIPFPYLAPSLVVRSFP